MMEDVHSDLPTLALSHIELLMDNVGYSRRQDDGLYIFVEDKPEVVEAAALLPETTGAAVFRYGHHSMSGDLAGKRAVLLQLANELEPRAVELGVACKKLKSDLFFSFNNLDIRHNNRVPGDSHYRAETARLTDAELEMWYDRTYRMCLEAIMLLERQSWADELEVLKQG